MTGRFLRLPRHGSKGRLAFALATAAGIFEFWGASFAQPAAEGVNLLVAELQQNGREYLALSLTGAGNSGCAESREDLSEELEAWTSCGNQGHLRSSGSSGSSSYEIRGTQELRQQMSDHWDQGRLLVSCYDAFAWLRTGRRPVHGEPPNAEDVLRSLSRVVERPATEASDREVLRWIREEYGQDGLKRLLNIVKDGDGVSQLKEFFSWFRDLFPYYHGACESCMNESTHFLGVVRPSDVEREDGGAGVSEIYFCQGCNCTTCFPRFRRVPPVLQSHRGRCGEYAWLALRIVEALGLPGRWVDNHAGHVWAEVLMDGRWVHIDPCEAAVDEPLLYATGWGRCPSHVLAYQANESGVFIEDVTERYRPDSEAPEELSQVKDAIEKALCLFEEKQRTLENEQKGPTGQLSLWKVDLQEKDPNHASTGSANAYAACIAAFVASTGFFHGYDNAVVNDVFTMHSFRQMMGWPEEDNASVAFWEGFTVNGFNLGAAVAAVLSGHLLVDRHGRRPALKMGTMLFATGGGLQASAMNQLMLILGRLLAGIGVGITSAAAPAFISEVSPSKIRGMLVGIYQNNVCLAIVFAALLNYFMHDLTIGWRISLGLQVALGSLVFVGLLFVCETPRFLESKGRSTEALEVLTRLRAGDRDAAKQELAEVQEEIAEEQQTGEAAWSEIFTTPFFRNVVLIGCLVQFFQITTGINAVVSFSGTLFKALGISGLGPSLVPFIAFTLGNMVGSFFLVDRVGRRLLLLLGMITMCITMLVGGSIALLAHDPATEEIPATAGAVIVAMIVTYMFAFGISWGFGAWLYISEIMPLRVRGKAVGLCTAVNWGPANILSAFITPQMISSPMGPGGTLLFFGCVCLIVIPFAATCLPETKGKTLEEVVPLFRFSGWSGFRHFVKGNLKGGLGYTGELSVDTCSTETGSCES